MSVNCNKEFWELVKIIFFKFCEELMLSGSDRFHKALAKGGKIALNKKDQ